MKKVFLGVMLMLVMVIPAYAILPTEDPKLLPQSPSTEELNQQPIPGYPKVVLTPQQVMQIVNARLERKEIPLRSIEELVKEVLTALNKTGADLQKLIYEAYTAETTKDKLNLVKKIEKSPLVNIKVSFKDRNDLEGIEEWLQNLGYHIVGTNIEKKETGLFNTAVITVSLLGKKDVNKDYFTLTPIKLTQKLIDVGIKKYVLSITSHNIEIKKP
ncbi:MAG: hypothetical protein NC834_03025 [Candidatus Omnitrophica bacterium]|nr:hypothetical protein [Candidatus Omnitrophota bacterium]